MINCKKVFLGLILLMQISFLFSQEAGICVKQYVNEDKISWNILDSDYHVLLEGESFQNADSSLFYLSYEKKYFLQLSINDVVTKDKLLLELLIDDNPILMIMDGKEGDLILPFYTGDTKKQLKIIGGTTADIADFPWQVYFRAAGYYCGGSIIGENWILTAAHCVYDGDGDRIQPSEMSVKVGASDIYALSEGKVYYVDKVLVHEGYDNDTYENDIALLLLTDTIDFENAEVIDLISELDVEDGATDPGVLAWLTGWGLTKADPKQYPDILQKVQLPIVSEGAARTVWGEIDESILMAGYNGGTKDACNGDSGGPLIVSVSDTYRLAGIVSWGNKNCDTFGGYTRVSSFLDWIKDKTGIESRFRLASPSGDRIICETVNSSLYELNKDPRVSDIEWKMEPMEAGVSTEIGDDLKIDWVPDYLGEAKIAVRGMFEGEFTEWTYSNLNRVRNTLIYKQTSDTAVCLGSPVQLLVNAGGNNLLYNWYKDDILLYTGSSNSINMYKSRLANAGRYSCVVNGSCGSVDSEEINFEIYSLTKVLSQSEDLKAMNGEMAVMEVMAEGHNLDYVWEKDGKVIEDQNYEELMISNVNASNIGLYNVTVSGSCGTEVSEPVYLFVSSDEEKNKEVFNSIIYPNLVMDDLTVAFSSDAYFSIVIYDINGKQMYSKDYCQYQMEINTTAFSSGLYFLKVMYSGKSEVHKFVVSE